MSHVDDGTLHAYLDGELSPPEAQGVEAHLDQCPACGERLEEERALIARATELLARAAPPDRDLPPFRPGDVKPPVRLWWRVRLPLAWAATIALALGIGTYVGEHGALQVVRTVPDRPTEVAGRVAANAPAAAAAPVLDSIAAAERRKLTEPRLQAYRTVSPTSGAAAEEKRREEELAQASADTIRIRGGNAVSVAQESTPLVVDKHRMAAKAAAPEPARRAMKSGFAGYEIMGGPIGVDSARVLLGQEPLVLPDVPIRAIYRGRIIGYSGVVIIEQVLDSATILEVINGRETSVQLGEVVVAGAAAARQDSQSPGAQALLNARADSIAAASRPAPTPVAKMKKAEGAGSGLFVDVRGPLPADSLAALHRLLRPLGR